MYDPRKPYKHKLVELIARTWHTPYVKVEKGLYPVITKKFSAPEVHHTDGIGTKGFFHYKKRTFRYAVLDALAMNLNDLAMAGAIPYALQNHIVVPKDDHAAILGIVRALAEECKKRNIAMTGGETSIHADTSSMDISITVAGFLPKKFRNRCRVGDVLIGLKSSGLHSNGFTLVREVLGERMRREFVEPTTIYADEVRAVTAAHTVHGMMHITGGAFTKLKDILGENADAAITHPMTLRPQKVFFEVFRSGVANRTMYTTFNCGIGFVLSVPKGEVGRVLKRLKDAAVIGAVMPGSGAVRIQSAFDNKEVVL